MQEAYRGKGVWCDQDRICETAPLARWPSCDREETYCQSQLMAGFGGFDAVTLSSDVCPTVFIEQRYIGR